MSLQTMGNRRKGENAVFFHVFGYVHLVKLFVCVVTLYAQQKERKGVVLSWGLVIS